jgi:hypothetical protein
MTLALANLTYMTWKSLAPGDLFPEILLEFQGLVRNPTEKNLDNLIKKIEPTTGVRPVDEMLNYYYLGLRHLGAGILGSLGPEVLDLVVTCAIELMAEWRAQVPGPIRLIHDASSPMASMRRIWDALVDPSVPPAVVGYDRRRRRYPIAVHETIAEDSKNWAGLQLADLLAGCIARVSRSAIDGTIDNDVYAKCALAEIGEFVASGTIWPQSKFSPEEIGNGRSRCGRAHGAHGRVAPPSGCVESRP